MASSHSRLPLGNNSGNQHQPPPRQAAALENRPAAAENKAHHGPTEQSDRPGQPADQGSPAASDELRSHPPPRQQLGGDLCLPIRRAMAEKASCGNWDLREAVLAGQENLRAELTGPHTTPLQQQMVTKGLLNNALALDSLDLEAAAQPARAPGNSSALSAVQDRARRRIHRAVSAWPPCSERRSW